MSPNIRFLAVPLVLGMVLLARKASLTRGWRGWAFLLLLAAFIGSSGPARSGLRAVAAIAFGVAAMAGISAIVWLRSRGTAVVLSAAMMVLVAGAGVGYVVQDRYFDLRYATRGSSGEGLWSWAQTVRGARIAVVGYSELYPFYGRMHSNRVQYVGVPERNGVLRRAADCAEWRELLHEGRWDFLIAGRFEYLDPHRVSSDDLLETHWTRSDPSTSELFRVDSTSVFKLDPARGVSDCAA